VPLQAGAIHPPHHNFTICRFGIFELGDIMMLLVEIKNGVKALLQCQVGRELGHHLRNGA
jgi:hypothetical protein